MQLCSANLPTGAYAFSQGFETATHEGWVTSYDDAYEWLDLQLTHSIGATDLPILLRIMRALESGNQNDQRHWNQVALAVRETKELRLTDTATGEALLRVLRGLDVSKMAIDFYDGQDASFVSVFALAAYEWGIDEDDACLGYAWSWLENQVVAATKLVPLGQTQSQKLLEQLHQGILAAIAIANTYDDDQIGSSLPALAIASCWHEHQYSRLFRS